MTKPILIAIAALLCISAYAAPTLHTTDFIANANRTNFVDFEPIGNTASFGASFTQNGVSVNQVSGKPNNIWTYCAINCWFSNTTLTWYPNGSDKGWTDITKADASDFSDMGLDLGGSRFGLSTLLYEVLNNGVSVLFGSVALPAAADGYIGFSGGGFDQVRLRGTFGPVAGTFGDGATNALPIDNIELAAPAGVVPEPGTLALLGLGLAGAAISRRRSKT